MLREKEGWTQKQLAQKAGMSQSRISALEDPNYENYEIGTFKRKFAPDSTTHCRRLGSGSV